MDWNKINIVDPGVCYKTIINILLRLAGDKMVITNLALVGYPACLDRIIIIIVKYTPTSRKVMSVKRAQAHDQNDKKPRKKPTRVESHDL